MSYLVKQSGNVRLCSLSNYCCVHVRHRVTCMRLQNFMYDRCTLNKNVYKLIQTKLYKHQRSKSSALSRRVISAIKTTLYPIIEVINILWLKIILIQCYQCHNVRQSKCTYHSLKPDSFSVEIISDSPMNALECPLLKTVWLTLDAQFKTERQE
jgi:hypothetical protein